MDLDFKPDEIDPFDEYLNEQQQQLASPRPFFDDEDALSISASMSAPQKDDYGGAQAPRVQVQN